MYLRETKRRNADGSTVSYLALAQNERDPQTGVPRARIIHRFGRADQVDREALARLVRSISRFLDPGEAVAATASGEVSILESRSMGSSWLADRLWERLEIGQTIIAAAGSRRFEAERVERAIFAMVANRRYSKNSKDHRPDLPQVVVGMAVTRKGIPVRVWTFPGNASDQVIIRKVKDDLRGWNLSRVIWVLDRGFTSERNRRYLQRAGGHYIVAEKLRSDSKEANAALARQGRYHVVEGNLRVKQVRIDEGTYRDRFVICHNPERAERDRTVREQILERLRQEIHHADRLAPSKRSELYGALSTKPAYKRFLRKTKTGKLRIDRSAIAREAKLDGKFLLRTSDETLTPADLAQGYKALYEAERGWRDLKHTIDMRPAYHRREDRIEAHVQLCWLALLLLRVAETETDDTWRNLRNELDRMHLVTLATNQGTVSQRTELTPGHRRILGALDLPEPPRFYDFTPAAD